MGKFLKVFINDFNIHNMTWEVHLEHLVWFVLLKLREVDLKFYLSKCEFAITSIGFLGHIVNKEGTKLNQWKVKEIVEFMVLTFVFNVKVFLGLTSYYKNYLKGYSCIVMLFFELKIKIQCFCGFPNVKMHWLRRPFLLG
jgi:hypothetical protein